VSLRVPVKVVLARRTAALLRLALAALVLALLVPLTLGPALRPLARQLGATTPHSCACGMRPGTCGCPECERLLHGDGTAPVPTEHASLGQCDEHGQAPLAAGLPPAIVPPGVALARSRPGPLLTAVPPPSSRPRVADAPPTPPPRTVAV